jgi:dihydrofolate reductase
MRRIRYSVAISLDGFIAGPNEEIDWITNDPEVDFAAIWEQFDTLLMGRLTYDLATKKRGKNAFAGKTTIVFSRTLDPRDHPAVTVISDLKLEWLQALLARSGKDVWLFGGGALFRSFLDQGLVDTVEVNIIPVVLGAGLPMLPPPYTPTKLHLMSHKVYRSGRVALVYEVQR